MIIQITSSHVYIPQNSKKYLSMQTKSSLFLQRNICQYSNINPLAVFRDKKMRRPDIMTSGRVSSGNHAVGLPPEITCSGIDAVGRALARIPGRSRATGRNYAKRRNLSGTAEAAVQSSGPLLNKESQLLITQKRFYIQHSCAAAMGTPMGLSPDVSTDYDTSVHSGNNG